MLISSWTWTSKAKPGKGLEQLMTGELRFSHKRRESCQTSISIGSGFFRKCYLFTSPCSTALATSSTVNNSRIFKKKKGTRKRRNIPENAISLRSKETRLTCLIEPIETKKPKIKEKYSKTSLHLTFPNLPLTALTKHFLVNIFDLFVLFQNNEGSRYW